MRPLLIFAALLGASAALGCGSSSDTTYSGASLPQTYIGTYAIGPMPLVTDNCKGQCDASITGASTWVVSLSGSAYVVTNEGGAQFPGTQLDGYLSFTINRSTPADAGCTQAMLVSTYTLTPSGSVVTEQFEDNVTESCSGVKTVCDCIYKGPGIFTAQ